jgi:class 3 adenylate cyclase
MGLLKKHLKARMTAYFLFVSIPVVMFLAAASFLLSADTLKAMVVARFDLIADQKEQQINRFMADQIEIIQGISALEELQKNVLRLLQQSPGTMAYRAAYMRMADSLFRSTFLHYGAAAGSDLTEILLLNKTGGEVFFSTNPSHEGEYHLSYKYFTQGRRKPYIQPIYPSPDFGEATLTVATPLLGPNEVPVGVLAAHVRIPVLVDIVSQRSGLGERGESYLVDAHSRLLATAYIRDEAQPRGVHSEGIDAAVKGQAGSGIYRNYAGELVVGSYRWLPALELALLTEIPVSEALQPATRLARMMLGLGLLAVAMLAVGIYLITRQIARPILAVSETTHKIAAGDLSQRAPVLTEDETGTLADNFNHMIDRLKDTLEALSVEQQKSEQLLLNILPGPIAQRLKKGEETIADNFSDVTILFADIVNFTPMSVDLPAREVVGLLNEIFSEFDQLCESRGLEKIKTIGDAYMIGAGLPVARSDHAIAIADMALDMLVVIEDFNRNHGTRLRMRIGINSGSVVAGVIGTKKFIYDIWGDAVNTAARMESQGLKDRIQVTETTYNYLKDQYDFEDRGLIEVKGKGRMHTYILQGHK